MTGSVALIWALTALAVLRISHMLAREHGPFKLCTKFRERVALSAAPDWVVDGVGCPMCISFWLALPTPFVVPVPPDVNLALWCVTVWWACSGFTVIVMLLSESKT